LAGSSIHEMCKGRRSCPTDRRRNRLRTGRSARSKTDGWSRCNRDEGLILPQGKCIKTAREPEIATAVSSLGPRRRKNPIPNPVELCCARGFPFRFPARHPNFSFARKSFRQIPAPPHTPASFADTILERRGASRMELPRTELADPEEADLPRSGRIGLGVKNKQKKRSGLKMYL
jgi:hypothetical protein